MTGTDVSRLAARSGPLVLPRTRIALAAAMSIVVAGTVVSSVGAAPAGRAGTVNVVSTMPSLDAQIAAGINAARASYGLARLRISPALRTAARSHSLEMARDGYFSHDSADGTSAGTRLLRFYPSTGYRRWGAGEALLWYAPGMDAAHAVQDWLSSPEHRAILLTPSYREIGISAVHATDAGGAFGDTAITVVTADLGFRSH
jgi:uncharacterized protein YkwD